MLNVIPGKRVKILIIVISALLLLATAASYAATQLIKAKTGGVIHIDKGILFKIRPKALKNDTIISVNMIKTKEGIYLEFGPNDTTFNPSAQLMINWTALAKLGMGDFTLYGEDGSKIAPTIGPEGLTYGMKSFSVSHFSLYYFGRR